MPANAVSSRSLSSIGTGAVRPAPSTRVEPRILELPQRLRPETAVRQPDERRVALGDDQERRLEAAVGAAVAPDLGAATRSPKRPSP